MINYKEKIIYCLSLVLLLFIGMGVGYLQYGKVGNIDVENNSLLALSSKDFPKILEQEAVTVSTKTIDVTVIYEDYYPVCKEYVRESKIHYGTTMEKVKLDEEKYQNEKGLVYKIISESEDKIVYSRNREGNCPNHFKVILEDKKINVYQILGENKKVLYMTIDNINVDYLRDEIKEKVVRGAFLNSKEELNKFIEDLES